MVLLVGTYFTSEFVTIEHEKCSENQEEKLTLQLLKHRLIECEWSEWRRHIGWLSATVSVDTMIRFCWFTLLDQIMATDVCWLPWFPSLVPLWTFSENSGCKEPIPAVDSTFVKIFRSSAQLTRRETYHKVRTFIFEYRWHSFSEYFSKTEQEIKHLMFCFIWVLNSELSIGWRYDMFLITVAYSWYSSCNLCAVMGALCKLITSNPSSVGQVLMS